MGYRRLARAARPARRAVRPHPPGEDSSRREGEARACDKTGNPGHSGAVIAHPGAGLPTRGICAGKTRPNLPERGGYDDACERFPGSGPGGAGCALGGLRPDAALE